MNNERGRLIKNGWPERWDLKLGVGHCLLLLIIVIVFNFLLLGFFTVLERFHIPRAFGKWNF